ncbi:MAG: hypothetical protein K6A38_04815 [Lachnospiraceae bacterium]|nr:hypothetical protein [Lachnospiraceae bacterium]
MKFFKRFLASVLAVSLVMGSLVISHADPTVSTVFFAAASCRLSNANTVVFSATLSSVPASDDGMIYLYQMMPYEYSITKSDVCIASAPLSVNPSFAFSLRDSAGATRICNKFGLCTLVGGNPVLIGNAQYITNPEAAATATRNLQSVGFVEPTNKMVLYRVGETNIAAVLRDNYSTAVIVNRADKTLINPKSKGGDAHPIAGKKMYYAFNAANAEGVAKLYETMTYFALNTRVDEFIIGNEVNNRIWNYTASMDWNDYVREYVQAFRVSYNAIKSVNANAKVYVSLDQMWNMDNAAGSYKYYEYMDGLDFLIQFNADICQEGNIDWNLCQHPYPNPMLYAKFWDMSGCSNGSVYQAQVNAGQVVTFQNLPVMTGFMAMDLMKSPKGTVREIILPEIGITQAQGVEVQAAAMMACYQAARNNPYIKRIYFHRMNEGGKSNFSTTGISDQMYNCLINGNPGELNSWALNYVGITDWRQIVAY